MRNAAIIRKCKVKWSVIGAMRLSFAHIYREVP